MPDPEELDRPYVTAGELRSRVSGFDGRQAITDEVLDELVAEFEQLAERYRGVAFVPRAATATLDAPRDASLLLPHTRVTAVTALTVDGTEVADLSDLDVRSAGIVLRPAGFGSRPVAVAYVHGYEVTPPAILRACREWVRAKALESDSAAPRRAESFTDDSGFGYRNLTANWAAGFPTGYPTVDEALNSVPDERDVGVA